MTWAGGGLAPENLPGPVQEPWEGTKAKEPCLHEILKLWGEKSLWQQHRERGPKYMWTDLLIRGYCNNPSVRMTTEQVFTDHQPCAGSIFRWARVAWESIYTEVLHSTVLAVALPG